MSASFFTQYDHLNLLKVRGPMGTKDPVYQYVIPCLDGDEYKLWSAAIFNSLGQASLTRLRETLGWNERKMSRVLTKLCEKGFAYRVTSSVRGPSGHHYNWILPLLQPAPVSERSTESLAFFKLPPELKNRVAKQLQSAGKRILLDVNHKSPDKLTKEDIVDNTAGNSEETDSDEVFPCQTKMSDSGVCLQTKMSDIRNNGYNVEDPAQVSHPRLEAKLLKDLWVHVGGEGPGDVIRLLDREPLQGYLITLGMFNISPAETIQLCNWIYNSYSLEDVFWALRNLCCAVVMGNLKLPLTTDPGKLTTAAAEARRTNRAERDEAWKAMAQVDRRLLSQCGSRVREEVMRDLEAEDRVMENVRGMIQRGEKWTKGFPITPWLFERWEQYKRGDLKTFDVSDDEREMLEQELYTYDVWLHDLRKSENADKCLAITGVDQEFLEANISERYYLFMNKITTLEQWLRPISSRQLGNCPEQTFTLK